MKKLIHLLFLSLLLGLAGTAQVKIGLPAGPPQASSLLDLSNTGDGTKALTLPVVATTASILLPVRGMLVYDISSGCIKAYESGAWTGCLSQPTSTTPAVGVNCSASAINGFYSQGVALTAANTVTIIVANNSFSAVTLTPSVVDIVLSGTASAGLSVTSVSPALVNPGSGGGTSTITYTLSGTPTTLGSFTATFTKLSLSCAKTSAVCLPISPLTITNTTIPSILPQNIIAGNTIDFTAAGGTNNTGIKWVMSSTPATGIFSSPTTGTGNIAQAVLMSNASGVVTVIFTATNTCGLLVTSSQTLDAGALYTNCATSAVNGLYVQDSALKASNTITIDVVNNSTNANTVTASIGDIILSGAAAGVSVTSVSPTSASLPASGGTRTFTYTLSGTPTDAGSFTASFANGILNCQKTGLVCLAITPIAIINSTFPSPLPATIIGGNTVTFSASGGTPNTSGLSWTMTSSPSSGVFSSPSSGIGNTATAILVANTTGRVTITFTATSACGLIATQTQTVSTGDGLRAALSAAGCTSCAAYDAAASDAWVSVTAAEYVQIDNYMPVNIAAGSEALMNAATSTNFSTQTICNVIGPNVAMLPANNYVVAFSVKCAGATSTAVPYLKYSLAQTTGFSGTSSNTIKVTGSGTGVRIYNIKKRPAAVVNALNPMYVGLYTGGGATGWISTATLVSCYYVSGDGSNLTTSGPNNGPQYQVKATAAKVW